MTVWLTRDLAGNRAPPPSCSAHAGQPNSAGETARQTHPDPHADHAVHRCLLLQPFPRRRLRGLGQGRRPHGAASGVLKQPVPNSSLAETMALVNGIHLAIAAMRPPAASKIIAQTDCLAAIEALSGMLRRAQAIRQYAAVVAAYREKVAAAGVVVEFRHVRGHKGTVTPRNAVNTWCDEECRRLMRAARTALLGPRNKHAPAPPV